MQSVGPTLSHELSLPLLWSARLFQPIHWHFLHATRLLVNTHPSSTRAGISLGKDLGDPLHKEELWTVTKGSSYESISFFKSIHWEVWFSYSLYPAIATIMGQNKAASLSPSCSHGFPGSFSFYLLPGLTKELPGTAWGPPNGGFWSWSSAHSHSHWVARMALQYFREFTAGTSSQTRCPCQGRVFKLMFSIRKMFPEWLIFFSDSLY